MDTSTRVVLTGIIFWTLLQIPRFIAIPLLGDVLGGLDSPAWFFPAILDVIVAATAPAMAYLLWKRRNLTTWVLAILFFTVSIIDHMNSVSADFLTATPLIFGGETGPQPMVVSSLQAVVDLIAVVLLTGRRLKAEFLWRVG